MTLPIEIRDSRLGASFAVRVHPSGGRTAITGTHAGALKLSVAVPPVDGRANDTLIAFLAKLFGVPHSAVQILNGEHARSKVVRIAGSSASEIQLALREHFSV